MQIQDSGPSTISDDRRRTSSDASRRMALAMGNSKADAFAELFQVLASSKVTKDKSPAAESFQSAGTSPESVTDVSEPETTAEDTKADEHKDNSDETTTAVIAQAVAPITVTAAQPVAEQTASTDEPTVTSPDTVTATCRVAEPQAEAETTAPSVVQTEDASVDLESTTVQQLDPQERRATSKSAKTADKTSEHAEQNQPTAAASATKTEKPVDGDKPAVKTQASSASPDAISDEAAKGTEASNEAPTDDRHRDRGERLRDRLSEESGVNPQAENVQPVSSSGSLSIDSSLLNEPTVAPETLAVPNVTANTVSAVAATVAASAAITVSESGSGGSTVASAAKADGKIGTSSIGSTGAFETLDDTTAASTMEKASKSRQSEIADRARLIHRISKAFQKLGIDGGQVRLKMHPDDLGTVQLDMKITGNKVNASVIADSEEAARLLQEHLPDLRQRLESQGLTVDRLQVEQRTDSGSSSFSNQESFQQQYSAYEEAAKRQSQRSNYFSNANGTPVAKSNSATIPSTPYSSRGSRVGNSGLDINF